MACKAFAQRNHCGSMIVPSFWRVSVHFLWYLSLFVICSPGMWMEVLSGATKSMPKMVYVLFHSLVVHLGQIWVRKHFLLEDEHGVAEAEEAVVLAHSLLIGTFHQLFAHKGGYEQQQGGARQMEVGNHGIHSLIAIARCDEEARVALVGLDLAAMQACHALQHAY